MQGEIFEELKAAQSKDDVKNILEKFNQSEWEIGGTCFYFHKMPALKGWEVIESIRKELGRTSKGMDADAGFLTLIASLDTGFVSNLRTELFKFVSFVNKTQTKTAPNSRLAGMEDMAFENLQPVTIYQVMWRSLIVNFSESFSELTSSFQDTEDLH